jgi:hypothetical protein
MAISPSQEIQEPSAIEDPFVTVEGEPPSSTQEEVTAPVSASPVAQPEAAATWFTPRADRLAETLSADNAQARLDPHACVFVAKWVIDRL